MDRLDKEILKTLLANENLTVYGLTKKIGKPFPTVLRHVKKLLREGYIMKRKGKRRAFILNLMPKGLVMLVFEGDIGKHWALSEEAFEEFLKMIGEISELRKVKIFCPYCKHQLKQEDIIIMDDDGSLRKLMDLIGLGDSHEV